MTGESSAAPERGERVGRVCVFAPSPLLTITVENAGDAAPDVHIHAGGQGPWVANMIAVLGGEGVLCGAFGGETGRVIQSVLHRDRLEVRAVPTGGGNGCYVEDRRSGELSCFADMAPATLNRHELDELYNVVLAAALVSDVTVLTGPPVEGAVPDDTYRRIAADLSALGVRVVADLSGQPLSAALEGGLWVLKVSHEELIQNGFAESDDLMDLARAMETLRKQVSDLVVVTRAGDPALILAGGAEGDLGGGELMEVVVPQLQTVHHRGTGDAMTAGISTALARGADLEAAVRIGAGAGMVNVTRHGLASGHRDTIEQLADRVEIRPVTTDAGGIW